MRYVQTVIMMIFMLALPKGGQAQINLVRNGSFEDTSQCPISTTQIYAAHFWSGIDTNWSIYDTAFPASIPTLIHSCAPDLNITQPLNYRFLRQPKTGNSMAILAMYNTELDSVWLPYKRDYMQGRLKNPLISGKQYCVTFHTTITQASTYAIDHIGAYLDDGSIDTIPLLRAGEVHSMYTPQVYDTTISNDTLNWTKIQGSFTANGTEKFITIGNFFAKEQTDTIRVHYPSLYAATGWHVYSWYLVDDVSVIATDAVASAGPDVHITTAVSDTAWIGNHEGYVPCRWYNMSGVLIDSNIGGFKVKPLVTTSYIMELDVCGHVTRDTVMVFVAPVSVGSLQSAVYSHWVYPNPATDELTIEHAAGCKVVFYDVVGREVASYLPMTAKEIINIEGLVKGVYLVEIVDPVTGERAIRKISKE